MGVDWITIVLAYVCPSVGSFLASVMFAAPIYDLRQALKRGRLGGLNPIPWAFMAGNCLGWIAYGYYTKDPFIVAGNLPGFLVSLWLNSGAAKVQYYELYSEFKADDGAPSAEENEAIVTVPQERFFMRIMVGWSLLLVWVGWCQHFVSPAHIIGVCVNVNLVFFYGAPLEAMSRVIRSKSSDAIHTPTMAMSWINTSFWMAYGVAKRDVVIIVPNGVGLILGLAQGVLVCVYPKRRGGVEEEDESNVGLVDEDTRSEQDLVV